MPRVTIILDMDDKAYEQILPVLVNAIDEDTLIGLRVKDIDGRPEYELAPEIAANVFAITDLEGVDL